MSEHKKQYCLVAYLAA